MKKFLLGFLGVLMLMMTPMSVKPAGAQVVVRVGPGPRRGYYHRRYYHHRYYHHRGCYHC